MAINQSQVDHIISTASADDPEIKMQRLQEEVDLIKKSIKKLLIDIRERMNETENPFIISAAVPQDKARRSQKQEEEEDEPALPPVSRAEERQEAMPPAAPPLPLPPMNGLLSPEAGVSQPFTQPTLQERMAHDERLLRALQEKLGGMEEEAGRSSEKLKLSKVHRLFDWTGKMVKKYGHDRLEIMVETYRTLGYISDDACSQVKDLTRLMPESLGELHEIGSEEFVSELYALNRILDPADASLDRDMIEVLMEQKRSPKAGRGKKSPGTGEFGEDWADMLDRS
ncbi:MAG: hypothetical protein GKC04_04685 [Methanomicrobiales archaeon]|nr:hypothetical protein [Methanomicrobiales archaeon]